MTLTRNWIVLLAAILATSGWSQVLAQDSNQPDGRVLIQAVDDAIEVKIGDQLFTRFLTKDETKPTFYPVLGPGQTPMTRSYPLAKSPGEAKDHPHHKSIWLGHEVNGLDLWANRDGVIKVSGVAEIDQANDSFSVVTQWHRKSDDSVICTVECQYAFGWDESARWIDATFQFKATDGDLTFNDTKEGMFAIRTHPNLRLNAAKEFKGAPTGHAVNSRGTTGKAVWGESATWVDYWGTIEKQDVGVAIFDHPSNFRHPTHWHAREYGLVAANPFGLHHFTGAEKGTGAHTLQAGDSMTFRYRMLFHAGDHQDAEIPARYKTFTQSVDQ